MRLAIVLVVLGLATTARADVDDDAKSLVEKQVAALVAGDAKAFADTFAAEGVAIFPIAGAEGFDQLEIEAAAKRWLATLPTRKFKLEKLVVASSTYVADLVGAGKPLKISGSVLAFDSHASVIATHIAEPITDQAALAAKLPKLPAVPKIPGAKKAPVGLDAAVAHFHRGVTVIGSAPTEFATTEKATSALLATWQKSVRIDALGEHHVVHDPMPTAAMPNIHVVAGHVRVGKVPMRVVLVYTGSSATTEIYPWALELLHFSIATK